MSDVQEHVLLPAVGAAFVFHQPVIDAEVVETMIALISEDLLAFGHGIKADRAFEWFLASFISHVLFLDFWIDYHLLETAFYTAIFAAFYQSRQIFFPQTSAAFNDTCNLQSSALLAGKQFQSFELLHEYFSGSFLHFLRMQATLTRNTLLTLKTLGKARHSGAHSLHQISFLMDRLTVDAKLNTSIEG